jgi:hypothetical protein
MSQSASVTFEVWEEEFKKNYWFHPMDKYGSYPSTSISTFMEGVYYDGKFNSNNPMKAEFKADLDEIVHDSYGSEDSKLKRVYYFPEWDIHIMFTGTRASHVGEEWEEMKEVKPTIKTYEVYE